MADFIRTLKIGAAAIFAAACFALNISTAFAQIPSNTPHGKATAIPEKKPDGTWASLKPSQQKILAPLESDWDYMHPDSRKKWIQVANIYPKMSGQDQDRLQSRMASWSNLSQKERRIARENYLSSLQFPAEKKSEAWSAYQKLSDDQKKKLAETEAKKKPTAANAPTLQQHPISPKATLPPAVLAPVNPPPAEAPNPPPESSSANN
jgi:cytochrome c553